MPTPVTDAIAWPTPEQVYDSFMSKIEPDLMTQSLPLLKEKYKAETAEEKAERLARYDAAYAAYDKAYGDWAKRLGFAVTQYQRSALRSAEAASKTEDEAALSTLETQFLAA